MRKRRRRRMRRRGWGAVRQATLTPARCRTFLRTWTENHPEPPGQTMEHVIAINREHPIIPMMH